MNDNRNRLDPAHIVRRLLLRDTSLWSDDPAEQAQISKRLGWLTLPAEMQDRLPELEEFADEVHEAAYRHIVLLGMGGSSLAPEVFSRTFRPEPGAPEFIVLDSTVPAAIRAVERRTDPLRTLFIVSSKSGTTLETLSLYRYFAEKVTQARGGDSGALDNFIAITDPGTPLEKQAQKLGFRKVFQAPPDVGGRYSALSHFGLVPAAILGIDLKRLLDAAAALPAAEAVELGLTLGELALQGKDKVTFILPEELKSLGAWLEQLLAESTGKRGKGLVPVDGEPVGPPGVYGADRVFVSVRWGPDGGRRSAGTEALRNAGLPVIDLELRDAYDLGREFLRWEIATATAGAVLGINPFDEPNVQESKDNTNAVLQETARADRVPGPAPVAESEGIALYAAEDYVRSLGGGDMAGLLSRHFQNGRAGDYIALMAYIGRSPAHDALLDGMRMTLRNATRLATTAGYGPRFLHSTGQLHKGGPHTGIFLQITADDEEDLPIPGEPAYGFSELKAAQAAGDLKALQARGRRVLRTHLSARRGGADASSGLQTLAMLLERALSGVAVGKESGA